MIKARTTAVTARPRARCCWRRAAIAIAAMALPMAAAGLSASPASAQTGSGTAVHQAARTLGMTASTRQGMVSPGQSARARMHGQASTDRGAGPGLRSPRRVWQPGGFGHRPIPPYCYYFYLRHHYWPPWCGRIVPLPHGHRYHGHAKHPSAQQAGDRRHAPLSRHCGRIRRHARWQR